jgi:hypothetical protein
MGLKKLVKNTDEIHSVCSVKPAGGLASLAWQPVYACVFWSHELNILVIITSVVHSDIYWNTNLSYVIFFVLCYLIC